MSIEALSGLTQQRAAHWYTATGEPAYGADLRRARKEKLYPSVTEILRMWPKPALERYKRQQDLLAALTLPRLAGEGDDAFCARVIEDAGKHAGAAADFGTEIHTIFEGHLNHPAILAVIQKALEWESFIKSWVEQNVIDVHWTEESCVSILGFGCRADALFDGPGRSTILCDVKTQGVKNGKPVFYDEWAMQLVANRVAANASCKCMSIVIDSLKPGPPVVKVWDEEELVEAWDDFLACMQLWRRTKRYNPMTAS